MSNPRLLHWEMASARLAADLTATKSWAVCSVNHTGTWSLIDFLESHPEVTGRAELPELLGRNAMGTRMILHFHVGGYPALWDLYDALTPTGRVIVPLRDPMQSLITRQCRHPFLDHRYIVRSFVRFAQPGPVTFFPVDLPWDATTRKLRLADLCKSVGLSGDPEHIAAKAKHWQKRNSVGDAWALKEWYANGNVDRLRGAMRPEIDLLLDSRDAIQPFLESQGYRDLPWWNL